MNTSKIDLRGQIKGREYVYLKSGTLYVDQPYDGVPFWEFGPAIAGDVGMDLPVRIKGMQGAKKTVRTQPEYMWVEGHTRSPINWDEGYVDIQPKSFVELPSATHVKIPDDAWGMIRARSSTGWKKHLVVFHGTIDSGYIGQLLCLIYNPTDDVVRVSDGDRLAQLVLVPKYPLENIAYVDYLPDTDRGDGGFGSSDKKIV